MKFSISDLLVVLTVVAIAVVLNMRPHKSVSISDSFFEYSTLSYGAPTRFLEHQLPVVVKPVAFDLGNKPKPIADLSEEKMTFHPFSFAENLAKWIAVIAGVLVVKHGWRSLLPKRLTATSSPP